MVFVYSFTIEGYDMTVTIEFFSHIIVLEDSSLESFLITCYNGTYGICLFIYY